MTRNLKRNLYLDKNQTIKVEHAQF